MDGLIYKISNNMSKSRKPRHNPDKKQNNYQEPCSYYETHQRGSTQIHLCELGEDVSKCNGIRHLCVKNLYAKLASNKPL